MTHAADLPFDTRNADQMQWMANEFRWIDRQALRAAAKNEMTQAQVEELLEDANQASENECSEDSPVREIVAAYKAHIENEIVL